MTLTKTIHKVLLEIPMMTPNYYGSGVVRKNKKYLKEIS